MTHITVGAAVALPVPSAVSGTATHSHIKSRYPVAGAATAYPIFVNKMDTIICAPFHLNLTDTVENQKRLDGVKSIVHDFFSNNGFVGLELENATEVAFKDLLQYFSGYPIRVYKERQNRLVVQILKRMKRLSDF